ncbi:MAG: ArsR/SmtB family transcription factor [Halodesulfurarchaeum sp.]
MAPEERDYRVSPETMADLETIAEREVDPPLGVFKALADERRLLVMRLLGESELCVCDLVELFDVEYSKLSYHLKQLREAGLVETDRSGNFVTYRPTERGEEVIEVLERLC